MPSYVIWSMFYLVLLILSVLSVIAAAYALALQIFLFSCLVLVGIIILKS